MTHSFERKYRVVREDSWVHYVDTLEEVRQIDAEHPVKFVWEGYADMVEHPGATEYIRRNTRELHAGDWKPQEFKTVVA